MSGNDTERPGERAAGGMPVPAEAGPAPGDDQAGYERRPADDTVRAPREPDGGAGAPGGATDAPSAPGEAPSASGPRAGQGLASSAATHAGAVRKRNEDSIVHRPDLGLWAVADGAGGHGSGDVASAEVAAALEAIPPGLPASTLLTEVRQRLGAVHAGLLRRAGALGPGRIIATTVVVLMVRDRHYACLWAGDSRAYLLRDGLLRRLTRDHSLVQQMVDEGTLSEAEAEGHPQANVILRAVGAGEEPLALDKVADRIAAGDTLLLCSDGLFKALAEPAIAAMLRSGEEAEAIIAAAVAHGARDNVSVVVLRRAAAA